MPSDTVRLLERYRLLLDRSLGVTLAEGVEPVAAEILDAMLTVVEARRGFVGLTLGEGWRLVAARNLDKADIDDPEKHVSKWIIGEAVRTGEPVVAADASDGDDASGSVKLLGLRSVACLPLSDEGEVVGFVYLDDSSRSGLFDGAAIAVLQSWLPLVSRSIARATREGEARPFREVITRSPSLLRELADLSRIAAFDASVLLTGETGTGKSFIAQQVHASSPRARGPFVHVNCGALPESIIEAELFGAEAGAFTGARRRTGRFEAAHGGTLFLDELDAMPLSCQVKLLVVLQERRVERLGSNKSIPVDVRVMAAMSSDPFEAIAAGRLREDLYYRLAVFVTHLPPLRARPEDVPLLARHVLERTRRKHDLPRLGLSAAALEALAGHDWPGNVRELENVLDRSALLARGGVIDEVHLPSRAVGHGPPDLVEHLTRSAGDLVEVLQRTEGIPREEAASVFRSLVILEAVRRWGPEEAFAWLGLDQAVRHRNHHRVIEREESRLLAFCEKVGARPPRGVGPRS